MVDEDTISYDDSSDSTPQQNTPPSTGQSTGQNTSQNTGQSTSQNKGQADQGSSQNGTGTAQGPSPAGQGAESAQPSGEQEQEHEVEASQDNVIEETPSPDESNIIKPTIGEAVSESAENAYTNAIDLGERGAHKAANMRIVIAAIIAIAIVAAAFFLFNNSGNHSTTTYTTTIKQNYQLSSCGVISTPGSYTVQSGIFTRISSGACIVIKSNNVRLTGSKVQLSGNGPFIDAPPYTYGILVENASNVSVQGFNVTRFSYGVYFENSSQVAIRNSSVGNSTMSDISISNSPYTAVSNDIVYGTSNPVGAILIGTGSNGTSITNSIIEFNVYYGTATYSSNTLFYGDTFLGNQVDLYCGAGITAFSSSGAYSNSRCNSNRQCNFATCTKSNYDFSPAAYNLSSQVSTCGALNAPGTYELESNLNLAYYVNVSRNKAACITVLSQNVKLNCNGKSIINAYYGIYGNKIFNFSLENCNFANDTYGNYFNGSAELKFSNVSYSKGTYGIYLSNDSFVNITDSHYSNNIYGAYLGNSSATINRIDAGNNTYGLATNGSTTGVLHNGTILRNKVDLYCSSNSYNSSGFIASDVSCGSSDCNWATGLCTTRVLPPIAAYPINSCTTLSVAGNYSLNTNLIPTGTCIKFAASNINLNCNNHLLNYDGSSRASSAFYASSVSNITLANCNVENFPYGFSAYNSSRITLDNSEFLHASTAVNLYNISLSVFENVKAYNYSVYGLQAYRLKQSSVVNNLAFSLLSNATGFYLYGNSTRNVFVNNTASNNKNIGFVFDSSNDNLVANNTANSNANDYACNPASSGIYAELNGVNHGLTKTGCVWLVELPASALRPSCTAINTVNGYSIAHDMLYTYGTTCFSVYNSNKTTLTDGSYINCEGHTIYAENGGIFANIYNTSRIEIENCFLKNFTQAIVSSGTYTNVLNTTIANSVNGIVLNGAGSSVIKDVNIFNATDTAIILNKSAGDTISSVKISNSTTGINFGATSSSLAGSSVSGTAYSIYCPTVSPSGNSDLGGNSCSSTNCPWLTSTACKA